MPKRLYIHLTDEQRRQLRRIQRTSPKAYLRERATAILKIGDGLSPHWVAQHGLWYPRSPDCIYRWVKRFLAEGVKGLEIRKGRGRKPAFSPSLPDQGGGPDRRPAPLAP
jgi:hypothetical protein